MAGLLSLEDAQTCLLGLAPPLPAETIRIEHAAGRRAADNIHARRAQPSVDLSAMDGYAIRHADLPGPFKVIGESVAGHGYQGSIGAGEAIRIFTGAAVPEGADTIVIQEDCQRNGDMLHVTAAPPAKGRNIRLKGNDFNENALLITAGQRISAAHIGLAIMGGHGSIPVYRRARIALISTGDELVPPGGDSGPNQIPASNGPMLAALLRAQGAEVDDHGIIADELSAIREAIARARHHDVIITIGGASVGDLDLVKPALDAAGAELDFIKVAIKPGKPLMAGRLDKAVVVGLPGNPVSAFVTAYLFALPLVRHLMGASQPLPPAIDIPLGDDMPAAGSRTEFIRGVIKDGAAWPLTNQDSAALASLARAEVLIQRDANAPAAASGSLTKAIRLD